MPMRYLQAFNTILRIFMNEDLESIKCVVDKLPEIPGVEYKSIINEPSPEVISYCDIIILKRYPYINISHLKKELRPWAKIVLCINVDEEDDITEEDLSLLNDVWIYPLSQSRALLRLKSLTEEILHTRESALYQNWLDTLMDIVPDMIWFKNLNGEHLKVNKAFSQTSGKTRKMILGKTHREIWGEEDSSCVDSEMEVLNSQEKRSFNEILVINDVPHHLQTHKIPFRDLNGNIVGTLGVAQDLTNLLNLNTEIGMFIEAMPFSLILTDADDKVTHVNDNFLKIFDECRSDMINTDYNAWSEWAFERLSDVTGLTFRFKHTEKELIIQLIKTQLKNCFDEVIGTVRAFIDVTLEKTFEAHIWNAANVDALTGLANRHAFNEWIRENKTHLAHLIYLDLDNFKYVNDTFGHKAGDQALCTLADSIREVFPDDFAARIGGDEFVICLCQKIEAPFAVSLAENLQKTAAAFFQSSDRLKTLSLSVGIRPDCAEVISIDQLIREADMTMYRAKQLGKGRVELWAPQE